jgi:hypothetical protein
VIVTRDYRVDNRKVNGMTLAAFTGYFRTRTSSKNTLYPYGSYVAHVVLGVIYTQVKEGMDERKVYSLNDVF